MHFVIPAPQRDVRCRRWRTARAFASGGMAIRDGMRLSVTHGNGFASDAYLPFWQQFLPAFDVLVFDFRNHGQNVPVNPPIITTNNSSRDLERVMQARELAFRREAHRRHLPFHVGPHRDEARDRDRLALGRAGPVRSAQCARSPAIRSIRSWKRSRTG